MIIYLNQENPEIRTLKKISADLLNGEIYIFPTDTVYCLCADSTSKIGIEKLYKLKSLNKNKPLSLLFPDISSTSKYIEHLSNPGFKLMKKLTPGPFTFILKANRNILRHSLTNEKSKEIGIRIPNNTILMSLINLHPNPLTSTSVLTDDKYLIDVSELEMIYKNKVSGIIDGGILEVGLSTIIDLTKDSIEVIREGKGFELLS